MEVRGKSPRDVDVNHSSLLIPKGYCTTLSGEARPWQNACVKDFWSDMNEAEIYTCSEPFTRGGCRMRLDKFSGPAHILDRRLGFGPAQKKLSTSLYRILSQIHTTCLPLPLGSPHRRPKKKKKGELLKTPQLIIYRIMQFENLAHFSQVPDKKLPSERAGLVNSTTCPVQLEERMVQKIYMRVDTHKMVKLKIMLSILILPTYSEKLGPRHVSFSHQGISPVFAIIIETKFHAH